MADEILDRIEKHMEGTSLGLAALAEVLQKMDGRMEADDAYAIEKAEQEQAAIEHANLVKNIAKSVLIELSDQGMDVDGTAIETVGKPDPTKSATATPNYVGEIVSDVTDQNYVGTGTSANTDWAITNKV